MQFINLNGLQAGKKTIEVTGHGKTWDLHNSCELLEMRHEFGNRTVELLFNYIDYESGKPAYRLSLLFGMVVNFEIVPRHNRMPFDEDDTIDYLYLSTKNDEIEIRIMSGMKIRIGCGKLSFVAEDMGFSA